MGELVMVRAGGAAPPDVEPPVVPPGTATFSSSQTDIYQMQTLPLMARGDWYTDSTFGTTIKKITDISMGNGPGVYALGHEYSRYCPLSKDGTYFMAISWSSGPGSTSYWWAVFNTSSGARASDWISSGSGGDPEFNWSVSDDAVAYFLKDRYQYRLDMPAATITQLFTVLRASGTAYAYLSTVGEGRPSDDMRWQALLGRSNPIATATNEWIMYDRLSNSIYARRAAPQYANWVGTTPLTGQFACGGDQGSNNTNLYDRNLNFVRRLTYIVTHGDFAIGSDGEEYWVYVAQGALQAPEVTPNREALTRCRISDGTRTTVPGPRQMPNSAVHISGICSRAHPDWVMMSHYSSALPSPFVRPCEHEIWFHNFMTGEQKRIAHTHNVPPAGEAKNYVMETQATTNWAGDKILFHSNFRTAAPTLHIENYLITGTFW
jgi:hypothetical protein